MTGITTKTTITLTVPIQVHGEPVSELQVRRATARDMRELPAGAIKKMGELYDFAASCCDIPPTSFEQLDATDLTQVMGIVAGFLDGGTPVALSP
jgi:Phage tail assembly chaperone proteins, E, or 41 or 14